MTNYAVVDGSGVIANRIILDDPTSWAPPEGCTIIVEQDGAPVYEIGGTLVGGVYNPPPPMPAPLPPPVLGFISDRQFFQQLAVQGVITNDEALAAVKTGTIPAALQGLINALPADQQFAATMLVAGATTFDRNHPLTLTIGQAFGWSSDQMDTLWIAAAEL